MTPKLAGFLLLGVACLLPACSTATKLPNKKNKWDRDAKQGSGPVMTVRTTAYTHTESDHVSYGAKNALGGQLKYYSGVKSAAADWSKFPVGTRFQIVGMPDVWEIDDYGSALVGKNTIDLYKPSSSVMNRWGARDVKIRILKWGSYRKSMAILQERDGYSHVRQMVSALEKKVSPPKDS